MPVYEFHCPSCDKSYETRVERMGETAPCPTCGSEKVTRLLSASAIHSKSASSAMPCASGKCPMPEMGGYGGGGLPPCAGGMCGLG